MPKPTILHVGPLGPPYEARYRAVFDLVELQPGGAVPANHGEIRALIACAPIPASLIAALPNLGLIAAFGTGTDKIDLAAAKARGIIVANAPDPTVACVADLAIALALATVRGIVPADRFVRSGAWERGGFPLMPRFHSRRMGILGLGRIGRAIARRAEAFDMEVSYHNRSIIADVPYHYMNSVDALASACDILVVACPGGPATRNLVNATTLAALGPTGILVNIARGTIVDEAALLDALERRTIAGAGLDVFADEPRMSPRFWSLDNAVLMPHRGGGTIETWAETADDTIANIQAFLAGKRPPGQLAS